MYLTLIVVRMKGYMTHMTSVTVSSQNKDHPCQVLHQLDYYSVSEEDNRVAKKLCTISKNAFGKNNASLDLIKEIMKLKNLDLPKTSEEGVLLYKNITSEIERIN